MQCQGYQETIDRFDTERLPQRRVEVHLTADVPGTVAVTVLPATAAGPKLAWTSVDRPGTSQSGAVETLTLAPGLWTISATADGFQRKTRVVNVRAGEAQELELRLKPEKVTVRIAVPPPLVIRSVEIDGVHRLVEKGQNAIELAVRIGKHKVRLTWSALQAPGAVGVPTTLEETRDVEVPREGGTLEFPAP